MRAIARHWALACALLVLGGCYGSSAGPSPADLTSLVAALSARGFQVEQATGGDPGCNASPLYREATRLDLIDTGPDRRHVVYVFKWRNQRAFDAAADGFEACVDEFEAAAGAPVGPIMSAGLWRAYGPDLDPVTAARLSDALAATDR